MKRVDEDRGGLISDLGEVRLRMKMGLRKGIKGT